VDCAGKSWHLRAHGARLRLYGIHFTGGRSASDGGSFFLNASHVELVACRISNSSANDQGGAIFVSGGSLRADACTFTANMAAGSGGALSAHAKATIFVRNSSLNGCHASQLGGAIGLFGGSSLHLTDVAVKGSTAGLIGGGMYHGGASLVSNSLVVEHCSAESGGGIGYSSPIRVAGPLRISACKATGGDGGGLYGVGGSARVYVEAAQNVLVETCSASRNGGGISLHYAAQISTGPPSAAVLSLRRNRAETFGGGMFKDGCDRELDLKGLCWIGSVESDNPSLMVEFDFNEAAVAGGGTFTLKFCWHG
jgi:predicted outer membrane repeat protein